MPKKIATNVSEASSPDTKSTKISQEDKLDLLLEQQAVLQEEVSRVKKKLERYILWSYIGTAFKLLLILAPIIVAFIYLPPLIRDYTNTAPGTSIFNSLSETLKLLR